VFSQASRLISRDVVLIATPELEIRHRLSSIWKAVLALPARFGERCSRWQQKASSSWRTGCAGTCDSNLKRRGWRRYDFDGVIDQAWSSFIALARFDTLLKYIRDNLLAGETCFRLSSRVYRISRWCVEYLERNEVLGILDFHVCSQSPFCLLTETSKRDGAHSPAFRPSRKGGRAGRYNERDSRNRPRFAAKFTRSGVQPQDVRCGTDGPFLSLSPHSLPTVNLFYIPLSEPRTNFYFPRRATKATRFSALFRHQCRFVSSTSYRRAAHLVIRRPFNDAILNGCRN